jgi:hypothetical protein
MPSYGGGGAAARMHFITSVLGIGAATELLNKMLTGHFTDKNPPGHRTDLEIRPGVFISPLRGSVGDVVKFADQLITLGPVGAASHFVETKASPFVQGAGRLAFNVTPFGEKLYSAEKSWIRDIIDPMKATGESVGPVPFGAVNVGKEILKGQRDPISLGLMATGLGRSGMSSEEYEMRGGQKSKAAELASIYGRIKFPGRERDFQAADPFLKLRMQHERGEDIMDEAWKLYQRGKISRSQLQMLRRPPKEQFVENFKRLPLEYQEKVFEKVTPEEKKKVEPFIMKKRSIESYLRGR